MASYRAVREKLSGFKRTRRNTRTRLRVTLQPIDELGVDAAIIFSDILVVPRSTRFALYDGRKAGTPKFPRVINNEADILQLASADNAANALHYVYDALRLTKRELAGRVPLIGFTRKERTLHHLRLYGGRKKRQQDLLQSQKDDVSATRGWRALLQRITDATIACCCNKCRQAQTSFRYSTRGQAY